MRKLREEFLKDRPNLRGGDLVFIDECGSNATMSPRYGRAPRGARVHEGKPINYGPNLTIIGAITRDGILGAMTIPGATTIEVFLAFIIHVLAPKLRPGHVVVMDNLAAHRSDAVVQAIEATGARVCFLPPYSPDLNPIERTWSKLKAYLREVRARTVDTLVEAVGDAIPMITSSDCFGWFRSCGYDPST